MLPAPRGPIVAGLLALLTLSAPARPSPAGAAEPRPAVTLHGSAEKALSSILGEGLRVVAFGEYHQTKATAKRASPLSRFTEQLLPVVAPRAADLVVETWVTEGKCGKQEEAVAAEVPKVTQRPEHTESELVTLLKRAKEAKVAPHVLTLSCADYRGILDDKGAVDYEKLLTLLTELLAKGAKEAMARLDRAGGKAAERLVIIYGGALHNDLDPKEELRPFSFGADLLVATGGRYLEVDLYVPEYVEKDPAITKEPWWAAYRKAARPGKAALVRRGPSSYILLFPRGG